MSILDSKKLNNKELEMVSGGSDRQIYDLKATLYNNGVTSKKLISDTKLKRILNDNGITCTLNTGDKLNSYRIGNKKYSHNEIIDMINNGEIS